MLSLFESIATGFSVPNESQISLFPFLHLPLRHGLRVFNLIPQIAVRKYGIAHDVALTQKMVPFIKCETALRRNVVELVFGINVFDLDFGIQVDSVKLPIELNSVGSGHVSHRRTSAVNNHLDYRFIVFKNTKQSTEARKLCVRCDVINISPANICRPVRLFLSFLRWNDFQVVYRDKSCPAFWVDVKKNAILQQPNPRDQERVNRPCVALHEKKQPQIQWNCGSLLLAHPTYATECSTPEDTQDSPRGRFLSLRGLQQDQNPSTIQLSNAVLYFSHDITV